MFALHFLVWFKNANTTMALSMKENNHIMEKIREAIPSDLQLYIYSQIQIHKLSLEIN